MDKWSQLCCLLPVLLLWLALEGSLVSGDHASVPLALHGADGGRGGRKVDTLRRWQSRQRKKQTRLFLIQSLILQKLGFSSQPNITKPPKAVQNNTEKYVKMFKELDQENRKSRKKVIDYDDYFAKKIMFLFPTCAKPRRTNQDLWTSEKSYFLNYNSAQLKLPAGNVIKKAKLRLFKLPFAETERRSRRSSTFYRFQRGRRYFRQQRRRGWRREVEGSEGGDELHKKLRVSVHLLKRPLRQGKPKKSRLLDSVLVDASYKGWIRLGVRAALAFWMRSPRRSYGLEVKVEKEDGSIVDARSVLRQSNCQQINTTTTETDEPHVEVAVMATSQQNSSQSFDGGTRGRRALRYWQSRYRDNCAREKIYISFSDFGWGNWIVQPRGFEAGFCTGTCSKIASPKIFASKEFTRGKFLKYECCGPSVLKPLSVLHFDAHGHLTISVLDDFVIAGCGCRP